MITNKMNKTSVKLALMKWAMKIDGYDGAIGGVIDTIPWCDEIEKAIPYDSVADDISELIGLPIKISVNGFLLGVPFEVYNLNRWANIKTNEIYEWYTKLINLANKPKYKIIIAKNDEVVFTAYGNSIANVFDNILIKYLVDWDTENEIEELTHAYHLEKPIFLGGGYVLRFVKD